MIEFSSKEDFLKIHKISPNETAVIAEAPAVIDQESVIAPGQEKTLAQCSL